MAISNHLFDCLFVCFLGRKAAAVAVEWMQWPCRSGHGVDAVAVSQWPWSRSSGHGVDAVAIEWV